MVLSCTGGYNGASLSAGGQYFSPARSSVTNLVARISCCLFQKIKMRKSQNIRTYAFLPHDLPMQFSPILPFLPRFHKKARGSSATGFTQKRHTLYVYYSRRKSDFQMIFFKLQVVSFANGLFYSVCLSSAAARCRRYSSRTSGGPSSSTSAPRPNSQP